MPRLIMHLDMDAFFAAIEQRDHPEYRGKPVVVGAQPGGRGVVATCSYEARRYGIHSAMPISQAYKRCPQAIFVTPDHHRYVDVSRQVMTLLETISPLVEPISIDEAFVDITGLEKLFGSPADIGRHAKELIRRETELTASVGIGPNRLIAKIGSDHRKPDGLTVVAPEEVLDFLAPLPVSRLRGVGPRALKELQQLGIRTVGQLRAWPPAALAERFGERWAAELHAQSRGIASAEIGGEEQRKQVSKETTFMADVDEPAIIRDTLLELSTGVGRAARGEELCGRVVTLKIRLEGFETHTRQTRLDHATNSDRRIFAAAMKLFAASGFAGRKIRLLGVGLSDWESAPCRQLDLDFVADTKEAKLFAAVDRLTDRFGRGVIGLGGAGLKKPSREE
ncbi:MAG: DNA polymerase IV [Myxococcales bacterium]|nr:DNA polymerase IV [Myxococcales bacterium]